MAKYSKEERLEIGRKIYESEISFIEAGVVYGFSDETARRYQLAYEQYSGVEHHAGSKLPSKPSAQVEASNAEPLEDASEYEAMNKEQLIQELMQSKIRKASELAYNFCTQLKMEQNSSLKAQRLLVFFKLF